MSKIIEIQNTVQPEIKYDEKIPMTKGDKIQVQILSDDKVISVKNYKSIKEYSRHNKSIEYYVLRSINQLSDKSVVKKFKHFKLTHYYKQIRIFTIPISLEIDID